MCSSRSLLGQLHIAPCATVKLMSLVSSRPMDWRMMSTLTLFLGQQGEDLKGDARLVGQPHQGQAGDVLVLGHTADVRFFPWFLQPP